HAPARAVGKTARKDVVLPGNYFIPEGTRMAIAIDATHQNPAVYERPEVFDPDRFLPENENKRSPFAWIPFSYGARGCIGRQFALQEAKVGLAVFLRQFKFSAVDSAAVSYDPKNPFTSPTNLWMKITRVTKLPEPSKGELSARSHPDLTEGGVPASTILPNSTPISPVTILYGSNSGTSSDYAGTIAAKARKLGIQDVVLAPLDDYFPKLADRVKVVNPLADANTRVKHILLVVTSTYNGTPPDNAALFNKWIADPETAKAQPLAGCDFAVFGCGNKQWRTYQMFPTKVDAALEALGGRRFVKAGAGDANVDIDGDFNDFLHSLYEGVVLTFGGATVAGVTEAPHDLLDGFALRTVLPSEPDWMAARETNTFNSTILVNRELQNYDKSKRSTRHLEITVNVPYLPGDHLEVYPQNDPDLVEAVAQGFGLALDATFIPTTVDLDTIASTRSIAASLTPGTPTTLRHVLTHRADLMGPPTRNVVLLFAKRLDAARDTSAAEALRYLVGPGSKQEFDAFIKKHRTLLDLMAAFPQVTEVGLDEFLCAVYALMPRRYSIASSPRAHQKSATLAVGVVEWMDPATSKVYFGACSGFFKRVGGEKEYRIEASVKSCKDSFRPPVDATTPLIMVCAGTGLSPFMGFLQDRQAMGFKAPTSETHLFFGCRNDDDFIYKSELEQFQADSVISGLHLAFSRKQGQPKKYVQHLLIDQAVLLWTLMNDRGGRVYVCGAAGGMAKDVRKALERVATMIGGIEAEKAGEWLESRYIEDVWG
ncbi:hypothetical protein BC830DRAFT_1157493, partial [Chytriomyces sp. MP71]